MSLKSKAIYRNFLYTKANITPEELCLLNSQLKICPPRNLEILAYVRFGREDITLKQSLNSLLPAITKGVLVYHDKVDELYGVTPETIQIAKEFCEQNPGFKLIHYPHKVYGAKSQMYRHGVLGVDYQIENRLDTFYKFALEELKKLAKTDDPYLLKVDGDHIYDAKAIAHQIYLLNNLPIKIDQLLLPKVNCAYLTTIDKVVQYETVRVEDHFFVRANAVDFIFFENKEKDSYWEKLVLLKPEKSFYNCFKFHKLHLAKQYLTNKYSFYTKLKQLICFNKFSVENNLKKYFRSLDFNKDFVVLDTCEVSYNSLHFPLQKHWEVEEQHYPNLQEFQYYCLMYNNTPIDIEEYCDPNNLSKTSLYNTDLLKAGERDKPIYLIQNPQKILEIARSFNSKLCKH